MNILTRVSRLFKADIHGVLDNLEKPEIILQQSVRDMQAEIDKTEAMISEQEKQLGRLEQQKKTLMTHIEEFQGQIQFCLAENNEVLGKSVVRKKLQAEALCKELSRQIANIIAEKKLIIDETEERKEKLQAIRDKLALFTEQTGVSDCSPAADLSSSITQDDVELAFLYAKQRYTQASANGEKS